MQSPIKKMIINVSSYKIKLKFNEWHVCFFNLQCDCIAGLGLSMCHRPMKYIILNLNGLLVKKWQGKPNSECAYFMLGDSTIQLRRGATLFLDNLFQHFEVGIWSSMTMQIIQECVTFFNVIGKRRYNFHIVWDQTKCFSETKYRMPGNRQVRAFFKPLSYLWNRCYEMLPINTLLIDDAPYKACMNPPGNGIFLHPFNNCSEVDFLNTILWPYLLRVRDAPSIPYYIENNRLGQEPLKDSCEYKHLINFSYSLFPPYRLSVTPLIVSTSRCTILEGTLSKMEKHVEKIDYVNAHQKNLLCEYHKKKKKSRGDVLTTFTLLDLCSSKDSSNFSEKDMRIFLKALVQKFFM